MEFDEELRVLHPNRVGKYYDYLSPWEIESRSGLELRNFTPSLDLEKSGLVVEGACMVMKWR